MPRADLYSAGGAEVHGKLRSAMVLRRLGPERASYSQGGAFR